jgi:hypothetical protein
MLSSCAVTVSAFNSTALKHPFRFFLLAGLLFLSPQVQADLEKPFDHSRWDQFLKQFVNEEGDVNYAAVKSDPALLNQYLAQLRHVDWDALSSWPREEQIALWINECLSCGFD